MARWVRLLAGLIVVFVLVWLGVGLYIRFLNTVPTPVPPSRTLPSDNVYESYVQLVTRVKGGRGILAAYQGGASSSEEAKRILADNEDVLRELRALAGKPSVVTSLTTGERFVGALAFPDVTRLAAIAVRRDAVRHPDTALETLIAASHFSAGVMRGGATLHITTGFLSFVPVLQTAPDLLPRMSAKQCDLAAAELRRITESVPPLQDYMQAERYVRLDQLARTVRPGASRVLRFDIPRESYEWQFLLRPKRPAYEALDTYLKSWIALASQSVTTRKLPEAPKALEGILADESLAPGAMAVHCLRYTYIVARLRLLHAAFCLEGYHKRTGSYPARLDACVSGQMLVDPFSGTAFRYGRSGASYRLYSVGPNGSDDGGTPYVESRMRPDTAGDLPLRPTF